MKLHLKNLLTGLSAVLFISFMGLWHVSYYLNDWVNYITLAPRLSIGEPDDHRTRDPKLRIGAFDGSIYFYATDRPTRKARRAFEFAGIYYYYRPYPAGTRYWTFGFSFIYPIVLTALLPSTRLLLLLRRRWRRPASNNVDTEELQPKMDDSK